MAIAFDASSVKQQSTGTANLTNPHTCTGTDLILWAFICSQSDNVTSVTYNGVAMTQVKKQLNDSLNASYAYMLVTPATGANTLAVNRSGTNYCGWVAHSYTGASQTGQPDASASENASTSPNDVSITTIADNSWAVCMAGFQRDWTLTAGGLERTQTTNGQPSVADSNGNITPAGAHTFTWTAAPASDAFVVVSFSPAGASVASVPIPTLAFLGVG